MVFEFAFLINSDQRNSILKYYLVPTKFFSFHRLSNNSSEALKILASVARPQDSPSEFFSGCLSMTVLKMPPLAYFIAPKRPKVIFFPNFISNVAMYKNSNFAVKTLKRNTLCTKLTADQDGSRSLCVLFSEHGVRPEARTAARI